MAGFTDRIKRKYFFTDVEVRKTIAAMQYELPTVESLEQMLRDRRVSVMPVDEVTEHGFITRDFDAFVSFLTLNKKRTVMYSFGFYTKTEIERRYELRDSDKRFFHARRSEDSWGSSYYSSRSSTSYAIRRLKEADESDYSQYLSFSRYVMKHLDFRHPKELILHCLHEGRLVTCIISDDWVGRLPLPDGDKLREECINPDFFNTHGPGCVQFTFATAEVPSGSPWPPPESFLGS